jgi:ribokinase
VGHDVVVVGSINVDLVLTVDRHPLPGETLLGSSSAHLPGGKGANQAVAAARMGARTAMVGAVGRDPAAGTALSLLEDASVDLTGVTRTDAATGLAVVTVAADGENAIVVVPGANATMTPQRLREVATVIAGAAVCVLQCEIPLDAVREAAHVAAAAGVRVVLNAAPATALPAATVRVADPLVVNQHEAAIVLDALRRTGSAPHGRRSGEGDEEPGTGHPATVRRAVRDAEDLRAAGVPSVVVTLGPDGAVVADGTGWTVVPATPVPVQDTTGAGDAFVGAMAGRLADGADLRTAAAHASRVAAASVQRRGAQTSYPWRGETLP